MDEIRVGIFGVGHRGLSWLRLIDRLDGYRIVAVGDIFEPLNERALAQLEDRRGVATYVKYEDMLADSGIDSIALTVRCKEQGAMAAQALEAGKHVNSEVPAAFTMEDYNDVWSSTDGVNWELATDDAAWSPRRIVGVLSHVLPRGFV